MHSIPPVALPSPKYGVPILYNSLVWVIYVLITRAKEPSLVSGYPLRVAKSFFETWLVGGVVVRLVDASSRSGCVGS